MSKKILPETENKIIELYKNNKNYKEISNELKVSTYTIRDTLFKYQIPIKTNGNRLPLPEDEIIKKYTIDRISSVKIAKEYSVSWTTILNILKRHSIKRMANGPKVNKNLIQNYFENIDSMEKAYFLGFLITDGAVYLKRDAIGLDLSVKDEKIVKLFADAVKTSNKLQYRKARNTVRIQFVCTKMKEDLSKYGVVPSKTGKEYLPILNDEFMSHLIRGIFDGDGWITYSYSNDRLYKQIGLCGNENFVTQIRDFLVEKLNVKSVKVIHTETKLWQIT